MPEISQLSYDPEDELYAKEQKNKSIPIPMVAILIIGETSTPSFGHCFLLLFLFAAKSSPTFPTQLILTSLCACFLLRLGHAVIALQPAYTPRDCQPELLVLFYSCILPEAQNIQNIVEWQASLGGQILTHFTVIWCHSFVYYLFIYFFNSGLHLMLSEREFFLFFVCLCLCFIIISHFTWGY